MTSVNGLRRGDKVRVTEIDSLNRDYFSVGDVGTVYIFDKDGDPWVDFSNGENPVMFDTVWCIEEGTGDKVEAI